MLGIIIIREKEIYQTRLDDVIYIVMKIKWRQEVDFDSRGGSGW